MNSHEQWHLSADAAERYERVVARHILAPWVRVLLDAAGLSARERVLDLACGTGLVARAAAERVGPGGHVVGVDLNPGMMAVARTLPVSAGAGIEWITCSALDLRLPDASFDVVLCQQGLQFFPDKPLAMGEMRRVLVPGGRIALAVWNSIGVYNSAVGEALTRFVGDDVAARFCASRKAPAKDELERLATDAGFSDVAVEVRRLDIHLPPIDTFVLEHLAATPVAAELASLAPEVRVQIGAAVLDQLRPYRGGDGVTFPEETFVVTARL